MTGKVEDLAASIRVDLDKGVPPVGEKLPSEETLCSEHTVSRTTLRRALDILEAEGRVIRRHGVGTFAAEPSRRLVRSPNRYQWEQDRVKCSESERANRGTTEVDTGADRYQLRWRISFEETTANLDISSTFGVDIGEPVLRRSYVTREVNQSPLSFTKSYLRISDIAENPDLFLAEKEPWPGGTQHQLFTVGIVLTRITDQVRARRATAQEAQILEIRPDSNVVTLRKVSYAGDKVVEVADAIWPSSRIELQYETILKGL